MAQSPAFFPLNHSDGSLVISLLVQRAVQNHGLVIDIDSPDHPFDAGWASADPRIAARLRK